MCAFSIWVCTIVQCALSCSAISLAPRDRILICNHSFFSLLSHIYIPHGHVQTGQDPFHHPWAWGKTNVSLFRQRHKLLPGEEVNNVRSPRGILGGSQHEPELTTATVGGHWVSLQIKDEYPSTPETRLQMSFQKPVSQLWPLVIRTQVQQVPSLYQVSCPPEQRSGLKTHWNLSHPSWKPNESINTSSF